MEQSNVQQIHQEETVTLQTTETKQNQKVQEPSLYEKWRKLIEQLDGHVVENKEQQQGDEQKNLLKFSIDRNLIVEIVKTSREMRNFVQDNLNKSKVLFEQNQSYQVKIESLEKDIKELTQSNHDLLFIKEENQNLIKTMEEQLQIVFQFSNSSQKTTNSINKKMTQRTFFTSHFGNTKVETISKEEQQKKLTRFSETIQLTQKQQETLERISEKDDQQRSEDASLISVTKINSSFKVIEESNKDHEEQLENLDAQSEISSSDSKKQFGESGTLFDNMGECIGYQSKDIGNQIIKEYNQIISRISKRISRKISIVKSDESGQEIELEQIQNANENQISLISKMKQQFAKIKARQSSRTSCILNKLDQNRNAAMNYQNQLEQQISTLRKAHQTNELKYQLYINEQNEKIDELMNKLENAQQDKIRNQNSSQSFKIELLTKTHDIEALYIEIERLRDENNQFAQFCQENKKELQNQKRSCQNLLDEIKELSTQKQKALQEKCQIQLEFKYSAQFKKELEEAIKSKEQQIQELEVQIQSLHQKLETSNKKLSAFQQKIYEFERAALQSSKYVDKLQAQIEEFHSIQRKRSEQMSSFKISVQEMYSKISIYQRQTSEKQQLIDRLLQDIKVLQKNNQDLKYMNTILKKDVLKIKEIQNKNWAQQFVESPSKTIHIKHLNTNSSRNSEIKQDNVPKRHRKNYSFVDESYSKYFTDNTQPKKTSTNTKYTISTKENTTNFKPFASKDIDLSLNFDFGGRKTSVISQSRDESHCMTDRPITELMKKKYML